MATIAANGYLGMACTGHWFHAAATSVRYGGGEPLDAADVAAVDAAMQALAVNIPWQHGDIMLLDNKRAMHARRPFVPPRRVLAYLFV